jgi:hypothetical protein
MYTILSASADVAALVGVRIYPGVLPDDAELPAIVYNVVGGERVGSLLGDSGAGRPVYQVDAYAVLREDAAEIHAAVRAALRALHHPAGTEPRDLPEVLPDRYRLTADYALWTEDV